MAILARAEDKVELPDRLPVVALRDLVFFPYIVLPILIGRRRSIAALEEAHNTNNLVLIKTIANRSSRSHNPHLQLTFPILLK